jgi:mannose-6-phosphate isomerase-like protein (cupin superfamily)
MTRCEQEAFVIKHLPDLAVSPEHYADYRPIFETSHLNITHVSVHPGETVPAHTHADEDQVYWVQSGRGFVELDGVRTEVAAGSAVLIPLGTEHLITNTGSDPLAYVFFVVFIPERR